MAGGIRFTYHDANATAVLLGGRVQQLVRHGDADGQGRQTASGSVVIALPAGEQQYKFVVDGQWFADPENGVTAGEYGNSVVKVGADGGLVAQAATSNTVYSPKITIGGRAHNLMQDDYDRTFGRYELTRPMFDIDLAFDVRISDLLTANVLTNIDPQKEDVRDYNSRLNFKRGSLEFQQPDLRILAFNSEVLPVWDDPAHLVGNVGIYRHPFGYQRDGFLVASPKWGFDTQVLYADNSSVGGTDFPGGGSFQDFSLDRGTNRKIAFESDAIAKAVTLLRTERRSLSAFALLQGQRAKISTTDVGDGGHSFGFGDGAENVFAASVRHDVPAGSGSGCWAARIAASTWAGWSLPT